MNYLKINDIFQELKCRWFWTPKKIKNIIIQQMLNDNPNDRSEALSLLQNLER